MKPTRQFQVCAQHPTDFFLMERIFGGGVKHKTVTCEIKISETSKLGDQQGKIRKPKLLDTLKLNFEEI